MGKALVRMTIIFTTIYFLVGYYYAQFLYEDIMGDGYILLFELIVVLYSYSEGKYHCKYIRHCALGIFIADAITRFDNEYDFLSVDIHNIVVPLALCTAIAVSFFQAINHFHKVRKLKRMRNGK